MSPAVRMDGGMPSGYTCILVLATILVGMVGVTGVICQFWSRIFHVWLEHRGFGVDGSVLKPFLALGLSIETYRWWCLILTQATHGSIQNRWAFSFMA